MWRCNIKKIIGVFICVLIVSSTLNIIVCDTASGDAGDILFSFYVPTGFNATGLTYFQPFGWIIAGGHSDDGVPPYYQQIKTFKQNGDLASFPSFNFNHEGEIRGLAYGGPNNNLWILNHETGQTKIYTYTIYGTELSSFTLDPNKDTCAGGLTYGGGYLWYAEIVQQGSSYRYKIHKITTTGSYVSSFIVSDIYGLIGYHGLAYTNSRLWFISTLYKKIWKLNLDGSEDFSFDGPDNFYKTSIAWDGEYLWVASHLGNKINKMDVTPNNPPNKPSTPSGPNRLGKGNPGTYTTSATDPEGDQVQYRFDWGDGSQSDWTNLVNSGTPSSLSHIWSDIGFYDIRSQARDSNGETSVWSDPKTVEIVGVSAGGPYYGFKNYYVQFIGSSSQGTPTTWHWDFGDGSTANSQNPTHVYSSIGTYTATLTATYSDGTTATDSTSVHIKNIPALASYLITTSGVTPSWDGTHLSATIQLNIIPHIINIDGSVPGNVNIGDFSGKYDFGINWDDTRITIDLYPASPENNKMTLYSGVELNLETYNSVVGAGSSFTCGADGDLKYNLTSNDFEWDLMVYLKGHLQFPILRLYSTAGPVPISAAADMYLNGNLEFYLNTPNNFYDHVFDQMDGSLKVGGTARGGIGFTGIISGGLYGGIDGTWSFKAPEVGGSVYNSFIVTIYFGAYAEIMFLGYWDWEWYRHSWPDAIKSSTDNGYHFMSREYSNPTWVNNDEGVLLDDAFPASNPSISTNSNGDRIMVWAQDNLSIGGSGGAKGDGLEIWYSTWNKETEKWNQPSQITNDNYPQSNPSVALLDNGEAICVFNYLSESTAGKTLNQIFSESEIGYCRWNGNSWSAPQRIVPGGTTNRFMDSFPVIKSDGNQAVVVWLCDNDANIFTANNDKTLYTSFWNGASWAGTRALSNKNIISAPVSLAYKDGAAACAYTVDEDGNLNTTNDQNIYVTTFTNSVRNDNTVQITSNGRNGCPSINYVGGSSPSVSWVKEVSTTNNLNATIYYKDNIYSRDIEEVETGIGTVSSVPLFSISSLKGESYPLIGWNDGKNLCFKRRFGYNNWESKKVLHSSEKKIAQTGWDYNGSGEAVYAVFIEKQDINSQDDCQLRIAGKGQLLTPEIPVKPSGPKEGTIYEKYYFETSSTDPTPYDEIWYNWSWDDGTYSGWLGPYKSGQICKMDHRWDILKECQVKVKAKNNFKESKWSEPLRITIRSAVPASPSIIGPASGKPDDTLEYSFYSSDPDGQNIEYYIDWGDGGITGWIGPYESGKTIKIRHVYAKKNTYTIRAKARDSIFCGESGWSVKTVKIPRTRSSLMSLLFERLMALAERFPLLEKLLHYAVLISNANRR